MIGKLFRGALAYGPAAPTLSLATGHVYGSTATLLVRPTAIEVRCLGLLVESGRFRLRPGDYRAKNFGTVTPADNTIVLTAHGFVTGDGPYKVSTTGTLPAPLSATVLYWIIRVDDNTIMLADSYDHAMAGTAIDITTAGTPTHSIGMPPAPTATTTDDFGSVGLGTGLPVSIAAPDLLTVQGTGSSDILDFWYY